MTYEEITNRTLSDGMHVPIVYINDITGGLFINLLLFSFYLIISMGLYFSQKRTTGIGDFPTSCAVAGFTTVILATLLKLVPGLLGGGIYAITIVVAVLGVLWLFFSKD